MDDFIMYADFLCIIHKNSKVESKRVSSAYWDTVKKVFNNLGLKDLPDPTRAYIVWINHDDQLLNFQGALTLFRSKSTFHLAYSLSSHNNPNKTQLDNFQFNELAENFNTITDDILQLSARQKLILHDELIVFSDEYEVEEQTERLKTLEIYKNSYKKNTDFGRF